MELKEGGVTRIECRILLETFESAGGKKVIIYKGDRLLTDREILEALKIHDYYFK